MFQTSFSHCACARLSVTLQGTPASRNIAASSVRARPGPALKLAEHDHPVFQVMDDARFDAIEADKTESAENLFRRKEPRQLFRVAQTILQRDDGRVRPDQRRQQFRELIVGGRFESDQHHVAHADFLRRPGAVRVDGEVAGGTADGHAFLAHGVVSRSGAGNGLPARRDRAWRRSNFPRPRNRQRRFSFLIYDLDFD